MCLVVNLLSRLSRSNVHVALLSSGSGALRADRRARDVIWGAQIALSRIQNRRKSRPNELSASVFETLAVSEPPRGDQESFKDAPKSPKLTIYRACGVLQAVKVSLAAPKEVPRICLRAQINSKVAQKSSTGFEELRESF